MKKKQVATLLSIALLAVSAQAGRVYFATAGDGIYTGEFDAKTGTLSGIEIAYGLENTGFIAMHPTLPVLYATSRPKKVMSGDGTVTAFKINPDGSLTLLNQQSSEGLGVSFVGVDPFGKVVMAANYFSGSIISFQAMEDGSLSERRSLHQHKGTGENPKRQEGPHAHSAYANPAGSYAYVPDLGIDKIMTYQINAATGALTEAGFTDVPGGGIGPRHMKWSADGKYAYLLNELDLSFSVFKAVGKSGALEWVTTKSVLPKEADREKMSCAEVRIHPNEKFIYASIRDNAREGRDVISVFSAYDAGFERIATVPAHVLVPRNFNIDPSGKWLLAGGQRSDNIAIFSIDPATGLLKYSETVDFKPAAMCIEFVKTPAK